HQYAGSFAPAVEMSTVCSVFYRLQSSVGQSEACGHSPGKLTPSKTNAGLGRHLFGGARHRVRGIRLSCRTKTILNLRKSSPKTLVNHLMHRRKIILPRIWHGTCGTGRDLMGRPRDWETPGIWKSWPMPFKSRESANR